MADLFPTPLGFNGINLDNYFPNQRSYNSVVYVHKRFLANPKDFENDVKKDFKHKITKCNEIRKEKQDKGIQFDGVTQSEYVNKHMRSVTTKTENDILLNHTVQFAKTLVPLIIPPENLEEPVFYTVQTKKTKKKPRDYTNEKDTTYYKNKVKKINDSSHKAKVASHMESLSIKESISHSSQNTLDDFNINESLTCTISGISEKKYVKKERDSSKHKKNRNRKITISNSFEALATESLDNNEGANIKINLMNDTDKNIFSDSLKNPIIDAIKECIIELYQCDNKTELNKVHRFIQCSNEKLDQIYDKIACIERQIESQTKKQFEFIKTPNKAQSSKSSKLEQLGEDLEEMEDNISENTEFTEGMDVAQEKKTYKSKSVTAVLEPNKNKADKRKVLGGGELSCTLNSVAEVAVKPDKPNRIPTRFCWTDAGRS